MNSLYVWTIAGSDCTGGAGIQADTKTLHNLGVKACTVVTAVTAQNSQGVQEINAVNRLTLESQIGSLENEFPARVIKIGMLANAEQVEQVAKQIIRLQAKWPHVVRVVYDPVCLASNGGDLAEEDILPAIKQHLLPLVDVLTPNNKEVQKLAGVYVFSWDCMRAAANTLLDMGVNAAVIKGGHIDIATDQCVDYCTNGYDEYWLSSTRSNSKQTHGTGCTFASAMAAFLAHGYLLRDAFTLSKAYINQGLNTFTAHNREDVWQGQFPIDKAHFPRALVAGSELSQWLEWQADGRESFATGFASTDTKKLGLYPVIDSIDWLERLLKLGVKTLQYREKNLTQDELSTAIEQAVALGKRYSARLFINDHWELAVKHQAYGVHLGQEDIQKADLAAIKKAGLKLGVSTHGHYELLRALEYQPSYIAIGAIFPTRTKDMTGQIQGVKNLAKLTQLCPDTPLVAIGGITLDNAQSVIETGVGSIAVVTAITESDAPETVVGAFNALLEK